MEDLTFPYEVKSVDDELAKELMEHYTGEKTGFVRVGPKGYFFPQKYREQASDIYNLTIRNDDIFVVTYPRSGTTWTQELVWLVQNNLDFETSKNIPLSSRFPFLEYSILIHPEMLRTMQEQNRDSPENQEIIDALNFPSAARFSSTPSPRFIKTHLPLSLLPPSLLDKGKVIYVARDPRDAAVSHYHLCKLFTICGVPDDFKTFWNYFLRGLHGYSPILEHTKEAWAQRGHPNLLFLFYEELSEDLPSAVRKVAKFLRKTLTEDQVKSLCEHLNFNNFKKNASFDDGALVKLNFVKKGEAPFIRRGKVGGWRQYFDDEMMDQADRWITDNLFNTDLRYPSWDLPNVPSLNIQKLDETPARIDYYTPSDIVNTK
ncbi:sulfotransferase 1E1-like isoform X5 [Leptidea sinapis]|uniref:sulfotransferase 1E1-like isoform X5 n=1 Tax=Leptidea sinapis TaxID=189913 RepID=UPI0021C45BB5|nr:sulfotransferase 1E1-like isoform X5 [Leptidea sinapis]